MLSLLQVGAASNKRPVSIKEYIHTKSLFACFVCYRTTICFLYYWDSVVYLEKKNAVNKMDTSA